MASEDTAKATEIGVGAVGVWPGAQEGILADLPQDGRFRFVAFSDEGVAPSPSRDRPDGYYGDYNMLLQDPDVEVVLVDGPLETRRDFAVRALNAGCHVVLREPFCETAPDAERVMKTALRAGLIATQNLTWRQDADLRALLEAVRVENVGRAHGVFCFWSAAEPAGPAESKDLLKQAGVSVLDQMNLLLKADVGTVSAHRQGSRPGAADGFLIYLALRGGGWAICQASRHAVAALPGWVVYGPNAAFVAQDGKADFVAGEQRRTYEAPTAPEDFWANLHSAIRYGAEPMCHPVDIVRAMKLHEAALRSAELGEPVAV